MLKNIYNQTITILNKLKRRDTPDGKVDLWYKTVVHDAAWYTESARNSSGSGVFIGTYITVILPFHEEYIQYIDWKKLDDPNSMFTISSGDYIVLGEVTEEINASNVVAVMDSYGENVCQVRHKKTAYDRFGSFAQLKIEGV